jgi:scyllo-inositol 2-dehydrogenase (NADP+)
MKQADGTVRPVWREDQQNPANGPLYDLGSHLIDQVLELIKCCVTSVGDGVEPLIKVTGLSRNLRGLTIDDYFTVTMEVEEGSNVPVIFQLHASMLAKIPGPRFVVHGTKGSLIIEGLDAQEDQLRAGMKPGDAGFGRDATSGRGKLYLSDGICESIDMEPGCYAEFYENLGRALLSGDPADLAVKPEEAARVINVIEAVRLSSHKGQTIQLK